MWKHLKDQPIILPKITSDEITNQVEPVLRSMEKVGVKIDVAALKKLQKEVDGEIKKIKKQVEGELRSEINLDSPSQLADILFKKLKLPTEDIKKTQSGYSTAAGELYKIKNAHPVIPKILKYREYTKLNSTYLLPLPKLVDSDDRLHTSFTQDARTGRITSSNPNMQNIPIKGTYGEEIRKTIVSSKDQKLIAADYSQIELRIIACLSGDRQMTAAFKEGIDVHARTAALIFHKPEAKISKEERGRAKTINFGVLYGMSPFGLSQALGISREEAARYIFEYFHAHQGIKEYIEETIYFARKNGYIETLFGFKRRLDNINSENRILREADERMAVNTPVQGTAAEILKLAMIELQQRLQPPTKLQIKRNYEITNKASASLILTVHDELVVEAPSSDAANIAKMMTEVMEKVVKLSVPVEVEVGMGKNWAEAKN